MAKTKHRSKATRGKATRGKATRGKATRGKATRGRTKRSNRKQTVRQRHRNNRRKTLRGGLSMPNPFKLARDAYNKRKDAGDNLRDEYEEELKKLMATDKFAALIENKDSEERQKWVRSHRGLRSIHKGSLKNIGRKRSRRKAALADMREKLAGLEGDDAKKVEEHTKQALEEAKQNNDPDSMRTVARAKVADEERKKKIAELNTKQVKSLEKISSETDKMQRAKTEAAVIECKKNIADYTKEIKDLAELVKKEKSGTEGAKDAQLSALSAEFEDDGARHDFDILEKVMGTEPGLVLASEKAKDLKVPDTTDGDGGKKIKRVLEVITSAELLNPDATGKKGDGRSANVGLLRQRRGLRIHWTAAEQGWVKLKKNNKTFGMTSSIFVPKDLGEGSESFSDKQRKAAENEIFKKMDEAKDGSLGEGVIFKVNALTGASVRKDARSDAEKREKSLEKDTYIRVKEKKTHGGQSFYKTDGKIGTLLTEGQHCTEWMSEGIERDLLQKKDCIFTFANEELRKEGTKDVKILKGDKDNPIYVLRGNKLFFTNCHVKLAIEGHTHSTWSGKERKKEDKGDTGTNAMFDSENTKDMTAGEIYKLFWEASINKKDHGQFSKSKPSGDSDDSDDNGKVDRHAHAVDLLDGRGEVCALSAFYFEPGLQDYHHGSQRKKLFQHLIDYAIKKTEDGHEEAQLKRLLLAYKTAYSATVIAMAAEEEEGRYLMAMKEVNDTLIRTVLRVEDDDRQGKHGAFQGFVKGDGARIHLGATASPCNGINKLLLSPDEMEMIETDPDGKGKETFGCEPYPLIINQAKSKKSTRDDRTSWGAPTDPSHKVKRAEKIKKWEEEMNELKKKVDTYDKQQELPPNATQYTELYRQIIKLYGLKVSYEKEPTKPENSIGMKLDTIPSGAVVMGITIASYAGIMKKFLETMGLDDKLYFPPLKSYHYIRNIRWAMREVGGGEIPAENMEWHELDPDCCIRTEDLTVAEPGTMKFYLETFTEWMKTTIGKIAIGGLKSVFKKAGLALLKDKLGGVGFIGILGTFFGIIASPVGIGIAVAAGVAVGAAKVVGAAKSNGGGRRKRNNKRTKKRKKRAQTRKRRKTLKSKKSRKSRRSRKH